MASAWCSAGSFRLWTSALERYRNVAGGPVKAWRAPAKQGTDASQQGADTAASVGAKGDSTEPGKVKDGKTR